MMPAIILSSHTIGLAVIRALGRMGVPVYVVYYDKKDMGHVSKYVREKLFSPHPEMYEGQFMKLLLEWSDHFGHGLLIPADDATLSVVSRNKEALEAHYTVACVEESIAKKFLVKKHTYELAEEIGVPVPRTLTPRSEDELERFSREIEYPCLIKPCESHRYFELFRTKMVKVGNFDQMLSEYRKAAEAGLEVMVQELIPGDESDGVNYNSYFWNGEPVVEVTAEKVRMSPPAFGVPRVVISKDIPEVIDSGRKMLKALGFYGYSCSEFKKDTRDGVYKFLEVNGRHNRSTLLAVRGGVNFPWIEYCNLTKQERRPDSGLQQQQGIYWIDEFRDFIGNIQYSGQERYSLMQYIRPYLRPHVFATFDAGDLKPFVKRCVTLMGMALRRT